MDLPGFYEIVGAFFGVGVGLSALILLVRLVWPSSHEHPGLPGENCRERRGTHKDEAGEYIDITTEYERELKKLQRHLQVMKREMRKFLEATQSNQR